MSAYSLPLDEDGQIITSAEFGHFFMVQIEWNTDEHGEWVPLEQDRPVSLYGPFATQAAAMAWLNAYPDDQDVNEISVVNANRVRPAKQAVT